MVRRSRVEDWLPTRGEVVAGVLATAVWTVLVKIYDYVFDYGGDLIVLAVWPLVAIAAVLVAFRTLHLLASPRRLDAGPDIQPSTTTPRSTGVDLQGGSIKGRQLTVEGYEVGLRAQEADVEVDELEFRRGDASG